MSGAEATALEAPAMDYEQFGVNFIRQILHEDRGQVTWRAGST